MKTAKEWAEENTALNVEDMATLIEAVQADSFREAANIVRDAKVGRLEVGDVLDNIADSILSPKAQKQERIVNRTRKELVAMTRELNKVTAYIDAVQKTNAELAKERDELKATCERYRKALEESIVYISPHMTAIINNALQDSPCNLKKETK